MYMISMFRAKRFFRYWWQRRTRGWDDSVIWNLDQELAAWFAPRLRRFKELNDGHPDWLTWEQWDEMLDEMIWAAEWYQTNGYLSSDDELQRARKGLWLITRHLHYLWI